MSQTRFIPRETFARLPDILHQDGYQLVGPTEHQGAVVYKEILSLDQLPKGMVDRQAPGMYRLERQQHERWFDWAGTAQGLKPLFFTPEQLLWQAQPQNDGINFLPFTESGQPIAVLGVRACDLAALALQDAHFLHGSCVDPHYRFRRNSLLLIGVNCHRASDCCFCVSTGDGPEITAGADLVLDELNEGFLVQAHNSKGKSILNRLSHQPSKQDQIDRCRDLRHQATLQQRALPAKDLRPLLYTACTKEQHWHSAANHCLTCGNCAAVCPTCFCFRIDHEPHLSGGSSNTVRRWDTCFADEHSYLVGHVVRKSAVHKYRQWLTHKLATWHEQYGRSGCTGCGRCITWCPVGIDLVEEVTRLTREVGDD